MENKKTTTKITKKVTRKELQKIMDVVLKEINDIKVLAVNLESKKRKELEKEVAKIPMLMNRISSLEKNFNEERKRSSGLSNAVKQLMIANNSAGMVINAMEVWFDKNHPKWDEGTREEFDKNVKLLEEREGICIVGFKNNENDPAKLKILTDRLIVISKELGSEIQDFPMILALYLKMKEFDKIRDLIIDFRKANKEIPVGIEHHISTVENEVEKRSGVPKPLKMPALKDRRIITPR